MRILQIENYERCFCNHDSTHFHLKSQRQHTLRMLFEDCRFIYFHSLMKSAFLPSKGLLCLCDKQNNTWLLVDMEFLFSCSTRHLTHSLRSLVSYRVKYSKRNSISTRAHVLFSINLRPNSIVYLHFLRLILSAHPSRGNDFKTMRHNFSITWLEWKWNLKFEEVINRLLK